MIVDIYCRSAAQDNNTLEAQEAACRQFARDAGLTIGIVHSEIASGASLQREKLSILRTRYKAGHVQGVVVMTLDRLSRRELDLLALQEEMGLHHATLYSVKEMAEDLHQSVVARFVEYQHKEN